MPSVLLPTKIFHLISTNSVWPELTPGGAAVCHHLAPPLRAAVQLVSTRVILRCVSQLHQVRQLKYRYAPFQITAKTCPVTLRHNNGVETYNKRRLHNVPYCSVMLWSSIAFFFKQNLRMQTRWFENKNWHASRHMVSARCLRNLKRNYERRRKLLRNRCVAHRPVGLAWGVRETCSTSPTTTTPPHSVDWTRWRNPTWHFYVLSMASAGQDWIVMISTIPRVFRNVVRLLQMMLVPAWRLKSLETCCLSSKKCRLEDRRSAGFDHSQAYDLMCELRSN